MALAPRPKPGGSFEAATSYRRLQKLPARTKKKKDSTKNTSDKRTKKKQEEL